MCGIIGYIGKQGGEQTQDAIINQFEEQKSRGEKGFGLIAINKDTYSIRRSVGPIKALIDVTRSNEPILIFHHRFPTSTENKLNQTHPIEVRLGDLKHDYLVIHNGVISNAQELFKYHTEELGYTYTTYVPGETKNYSKYGYGSYYTRAEFNDTESFAIELARYLDNAADAINIRGSAAFIALQIDKKTHKPLNLFWGTNGKNPLYVTSDKHGMLIASEAEGDHVQSEVLYELNVQKFFNPKNKKKVEQLITEYLLNFTPEPKPIYTPPPTPVQPTLPATTTTPTATTTTEENILDDAKTAHTKMAERQLPKIKEILTEYASELAEFPEFEFEYGKAVSGELKEDLKSDVLSQLEEVLDHMEKRSDNIHEWMLPANSTSIEVDDAAITEALETEYKAPNYAEPKPVGSISKSKWLEPF